MNQTIEIVAGFFVAVSFVVLGTGCGPGAGGNLELSGKVTLKGQPLANGTIEFTAPDNSKMSGGVISQGAYNIPAIQGLPPGEYKVRIHAASETAAPKTEAPGTDSLQPPAKELIPEEFNVKSGLIAKVIAGQKNVFNFDIP